METPNDTPDSGAPSRPVRLNHERAEAMLAAWRTSGLSRRAFAQQYGVSLATFDRWRGRLEGRSARGAGLAQVATEATDVPHAAQAIRIIAGSSPEVVLPLTCDVATLRRALEACRC